MSFTMSIALCLSIVTADVEVGDKVVTLTVAPVMMGSKEVARVQPGVELTVTRVKSPWVGINVTQDGKKVKGWILERNLTAHPEATFGELAVQFLSEIKGDINELKKHTEMEFNWMDQDSNGQLTLDEFRTGTTILSLDQVNRILQSHLKQYGPRERKGVIYADLPMVLTDIGAFMPYYAKMRLKCWKRRPTAAEAERMADDIYKTGHLGRSQGAVRNQLRGFL